MARVAECLEVLRKQINELAPNRSKVSDGGIGDHAHSKRKSDHNANSKGIVHARDFTHDPAHGADMNELYKDLVSSRDPRIKYIIWNKQITSGAAGPKPWEARPYTGANGHTHHLHISVNDGSDKKTASWDIDLKSSTTGDGFAPGGRNPPADPGNPLLVKGNISHAVERLQRLLNARGAKPKLIEDQEFGDKTEKALKAFQKSRGLNPDGKCGPYTWDELEKP